MLKENFVETLEHSLKSNWDLPAFANYTEGALMYKDVADKILWMHYVLHKAGVKKGDKIALLGKNSTNWGIAFIGVITYGAVIVPILPDFKPNDVHHIVNHSDAVMLFAADSLYEALDEAQMPALEATFSLNKFELLQFKKKDMHHIVTSAASEYLKKGLTPQAVDFPKIKNSELAAIVYTSGTTGFSKGVMLPHNSLMANVLYARNNIPLKSGERILSFMPLAHSYGCAFEFLFPFSLGCFITFLGKTPSPKVIVKAFQDIKPHLILSVPLIIEKIYKKQIKPALNQGAAKLLINIPIINTVVYKKVYKKLVDVFGGNFYEIVIGGAALNKEVEDFLLKIKFPFTTGYGMTECGPLISYIGWKKHIMGSVGLVVDTMEVKIDSPDPEIQVGEIMVRGENVMDGYYKNKEATQEVIDKNGWLHTGDLGVIDKAKYIHIRGRSKDMILGPSGQNIYPEEVEAVLNNLPYVQESLVVERNGLLVALVYPDMEVIDAEKISESRLTELMEKNRKDLNDAIPSYINVHKIEIYPEEFEKTPKKSIKRFLYSR